MFVVLMQVMIQIHSEDDSFIQPVATTFSSAPEKYLVEIAAAADIINKPLKPIVCPLKHTKEN